MSDKIDFTTLTSTLEGLSFTKWRFVTGGDCNNMTTPGFYGFYNITANNPGGASFFAMITLMYFEQRLGQLAFCLNDDGCFHIKARMSYYNYDTGGRLWTAWKTISMS